MHFADGTNGNHGVTQIYEVENPNVTLRLRNRPCILNISSATKMNFISSNSWYKPSKAYRKFSSVFFPWLMRVLCHFLHAWLLHSVTAVPHGTCHKLGRLYCIAEKCSRDRVYPPITEGNATWGRNSCSCEMVLTYRWRYQGLPTSSLYWTELRICNRCPLGQNRSTLIVSTCRCRFLATSSGVHGIAIRHSLAGCSKHRAD